MTLAARPDGAPNFREYAAVYDLLYRDKDYDGEASYVARTLRAFAPSARSILELGSGTGRHGRSLAAAGFDVYGIERSADMVALAKTGAVPGPAGGRFVCDAGDVRSVRLGRTFDAVIALFHVVSYQTTDGDLRATFATAAEHLPPDGIFVFDVWHGPAVLAQRPEPRIKTVSDGLLDVVRTARPTLDTDRSTVRVTYDMECLDRRSGNVVRFSEDHLMRYLFPEEISSLAGSCGMELAATEEFITGARPSAATWSVMYALRKKAAP